MVSREFLLVLHLAGVISWMAGILYLIRLYVYHSSEEHAEVRKRFQLMERRLYRGICFPAMIISLVAGVGLVLLNPAYFLAATWFHWKVLCVVLMILSTLLAGYYRKKFLDENAVLPSHKFFRYFNEFPTLLMIIILILVFYRF